MTWFSALFAFAFLVHSAISLRLSMSGSEKLVSLHWFRKGLRLHDNPALAAALSRAHKCYPVFCIDPHFSKPQSIGVNRYHFLLESLQDIDAQLRACGSRLFVIRGNPEEELPRIVRQWDVRLVTFESDTEPYAKARDRRVCEALRAMDVSVSSSASHLLHDPERYLAAAGAAPFPATFQSFQKLFASLESVRKPLEKPTEQSLRVCAQLAEDDSLRDDRFAVPTLREMNYEESPTTPYRGGESEALLRLQRYVAEREQYVLSFSKPETSPNSLEPSTTVLSPYLKFGCLSAALFYHTLEKIIRGKKHTEPPVSLHGQLLWREFFYMQGVVTPNFDKMEGNPVVRQIPWHRDRALIDAWKNARTGFPYIDAIMTQLRFDGWIHHLARHSVACFLTRGDLWQHWEEGARVFDLYLLDHDWAMNNGNWQWLSCSNFFYQYFRCYSPIAFGKKTDKDGDYIRKWLPKLAKFPAKYIYEPWKAPRYVQEQAQCIIGVDYPHPIVDHDVVSKQNMQRMQQAYAAHAASTGGATQESEPVNEAKKSAKRSSISSSNSRSSGMKRAKVSVLDQLTEAAAKKPKR